MPYPRVDVGVGLFPALVLRSGGWLRFCGRLDRAGWSIAPSASASSTGPFGTSGSVLIVRPAARERSRRG